MLDIQAFAPQAGVVPPRPASLWFPEDTRGMSTDDAVISLLEAGRVVVIGGFSLLGEKGLMVWLVSVLQKHEDNLRGWLFTSNHPGEEGPALDHVDSSIKPLEKLPVPNVMVYFVGETSEDRVRAEAPQDDIQNLVRFVLPFISDEGPPKGIDWP